MVVVLAGIPVQGKVESLVVLWTISADFSSKAKSTYLLYQTVEHLESLRMRVVLRQFQQQVPSEISATIDTYLRCWEDIQPTQLELLVQPV
jgi:hypothetical protein